MKQIWKKLGSVLLTLCMVLTLLPTVAFAADASTLESTIESYTGGTGTLTATVTGDTVTVTGAVTDASSTLTLDITSGVTVIWEASITAASNFSGNMIELTGEGTFEVADGGTVSTTLGTAIYATSFGGTVNVSGGTVSAALNHTIWASRDGSVIVSGGAVSTGKDYGYAIYAGNVEVSGGSVSATTGYAIYAVSSNTIHSYTVTVTGGMVSADGGAIYADIVAAEGGTVSATGNNSHAITGSSVTVSGGTVSADAGYAIYGIILPGNTIDACTVLVTGGTVTSHSDNYETIIARQDNSTVTVSGGVVFSHDIAVDVTGDFTGPTGDGVVISWDQNEDNPLYIAGAASDLTVLPEGVASWVKQGETSGIAYTNGLNTGFIAVDGVTVASMTAAANIVASAIASYNSNLQTSVNGSAVTVTGTVENAASALTLNIPEGVTAIWEASITTDAVFSDRYLIELTGNGSFELADGAMVSATGDSIDCAIFSSGSITVSGGTVDSIIAQGDVMVRGGIVDNIDGSSDVTVSGGTVSSATGDAIRATGENAIVTVSGGTISSATGNAIVSYGDIVTVNGGTISSATGYAIDAYYSSVTVSGGTISSAMNNPFDVDEDITITGGTVFFWGTASHIESNGYVQSGDSVVIAWNQGAGTIQYDIGSSTDLAVSPAASTVTWIKQGGVSGISYANGSNTGFIAVDGVTVSRGSVTLSHLSYTDPSTIVLVYNGNPRGIGNMTAAAGYTLGTITVYYTGANGTTYVNSTTAPTNAGTYQVTVDVAENDNYAATTLALGEYNIAKATVTGVSQTYPVLVNSAQTYTFDLASLLPDDVDSSEISTYRIVSTSDASVIFSVTPSVSGTTLTLPVASVGTSGLSGTVTIGFTSDNYNISDAVVTVETVDKTPVTITADMTGGVYNGQPYAYSNAAVTMNTDSSNVTGSVTLEASYVGIGGTTYGPGSDAPTNAGTYQLTLSLPSTDTTYIGSNVFTFTIGKRPVTIKADDKSAKVGSNPVFTYTVDGQLPGETALVGEPVAYSPVSCLEAGSYEIGVMMTGVTYTDNYMAADPAYVNGTLTVRNPSSDNDTPSDDTPGGSSSTPATPAPTVSGSTATTTATTKTGSDGKVSASVSETQVKGAVKAAQKAAKSTGEAPKVEIQIEGGSGASGVETTLPQSAVQALVTGEMESLKLSSAVANVTFDEKAIAAIADASTGDVLFTASNVENSTLSDAAQQVVGNRPVYNFSVTSGNKTISQFNGTVTISLPYTPAAGEDSNAIVAYYINADGEPELMQNCYYDAEAGALVFTTTHFSIYAVGYNKVSFSDVSDTAWYSDAVSYLAARGITGGTSETTFSPNATLTRGQFITLLMRAYGIDADENPTNNFADAGNTYYTRYLAVAKRLEISNGIGDNKFAPEQAITRQEMFTLLYNALKAIDQLSVGEKLSDENSGKNLSDFTDSASISSYAQEAMAYMVETGVTSGSNGQLSPRDTTTRAQMAQVLYNLMSK